MRRRAHNFATNVIAAVGLLGVIAAMVYAQAPPPAKGCLPGLVWNGTACVAPGASGATGPTGTTGAKPPATTGPSGATGSAAAPGPPFGLSYLGPTIQFQAPQPWDGSTTYAWDFGDGTKGSNPVANHTYLVSAGGVVNVTLTITPAAGGATVTRYQVALVWPAIVSYSVPAQPATVTGK